MGSPPLDFESSASTDFTTPAQHLEVSNFGKVGQALISKISHFVQNGFLRAGWSPSWGLFVDPTEF